MANILTSCLFTVVVNFISVSIVCQLNCGFLVLLVGYASVWVY